MSLTLSLLLSSRAPTTIRTDSDATGGTITQAQLTPLKREPQTDITREKGHGRVLSPESEDDSSASSTSGGRSNLVVAAVIGSGNVGPLVADYEHDGRRDTNVE